jgi:hypothetical protein
MIDYDCTVHAHYKPQNCATTLLTSTSHPMPKAHYATLPHNRRKVASNMLSCVIGAATNNQPPQKHHFAS